MLSLKTKNRSSRFGRQIGGGDAKRRARNIAISVFVMLALMIGAGIAYTWYVGKQTKIVEDPPEAVVKLPDPFARPKKMAPDAAVGVSVQMLTSPLVPGTNAMITIKTNPEAKCTISVTYANVPSTDSGLSEKVADEFGVVNWTWTVKEDTPLGSWPVVVTCANEKKSGVVKTNLVLVKELPETTEAN